ncbi:MAG: response regulator [Vicinamibacterales bacterium]
MRILVVDDSQVFRALLRRSLTALGHEVVEAVDGRQAWDFIQFHPTPLVITDWVMPHIDGLELCRLIRAERRPEYTYIILLTMMEGKGGILEGLNAGADDYLTKPFDPDQLAARLRVAERILSLQGDASQRHAELTELNRLMKHEAAERTRAALALDQANRRIAIQLERLRTLVWLNGLVSSLDVDDVLVEVTRAASMLTGAPSASFWASDATARTLTLRAVSDDVFMQGVGPQVRSYDDGTIGWVARERQLRHDRDIAESAVELENKAWWLDHGLKSMLVMPVIGGADLGGVLVLNGLQPFDLTEEERMLLDAFLSHAAAALRNASLFEDEARARQAAEEATRAKTAFIASVSHELRTPMNGVIGLAELLLDSPLNAEQRERIEMIQRSGQRFLLLVNDILDYSKIEAGRLELEAIDCDVATIVDDVLGLLGPTAHVKGLELTPIVEPDVPLIVGDPARLGQVVTNLVNNAVKFTPSGEILVRVGIEGEADCRELRIDVQDTGIGIDAAGHARLFQPFSQVDASTTRKYGGTGLGLAICRRLIELMHGRIWVESEPGRGSTFSVALPLRPARSSRLPGALPRPATGQCVLLVAERATTRRSLTLLLEAHGLGVVGAATLAEATVWRKAHEAPAAVFVDVDVMEAVSRGEHRTDVAELAGTVPLVVLTRSTRPADSGQDGHPGAHLLPKPVRRSQLGRLLDDLARTPGPAELPRHASPEPAAIERLHVLVVEDNVVNQTVVMGLLRKLGHTAEVVDDGAQALEAVKRSSFALVLMDCEMPVLDGYEATRRIRALGAPYDRLPIVALTANAFEEDRKRCLDAGMNDFVTKPISTTRLRTALERWNPGTKQPAA